MWWRQGQQPLAMTTQPLMSGLGGGAQGGPVSIASFGLPVEPEVSMLSASLREVTTCREGAEGLVTHAGPQRGLNHPGHIAGQAAR